MERCLPKLSSLPWSPGLRVHQGNTSTHLMRNNGSSLTRRKASLAVVAGAAAKSVPGALVSSIFLSSLVPLSFISNWYVVGMAECDRN